MAWTPYQQAAIDERNANILVSAAAGSGKTAVLTERVFRRIVGSETEAPIDLDRFLIVTFTSAAAQEMKERIADKISGEIERLQLEEENEGAKKQMVHLEKQLSLLPKASISTIHSFCLKTVKNYFNLLDIDPNIKVGNEAELHLMKLDILEELLEGAFETEGNEDFLRLADTYASVRGMEPLVKMILEVHTFSKSTVFPEEWMHSMADELCKQGGELGENRWDKVLIKTMMDYLYDLEKVYEKALALTKRPDGPATYEVTVQEDYDQIKRITESFPVEKLEALKSDDPFTEATNIIESIARIKFGRLSTKKQSCDEGLKEQVKAYRDLAKKTVEDLQKKSQVLLDPTLRQKTVDAGELMKTLVELVEVFDQRFAEAKREKSLVDYNDLEHMCLKLLIRREWDEDGKPIILCTDVAKELGEFYEEIYMDEYQDTNQVQETLLKSVAEAKEDGPTRFMVGDMKQSIYRFRLANPLIFAHKYETFDKYEKMKGEEGRRNLCIDLSQNFRSRQGVLDATNDIFDQVMSKDVGELVYDEDAKLKVGNLYDEGNPEEHEEAIAKGAELHIVELDEIEDEDDDSEDLKGIEVEAQMVAELIARILRGEGNPKVVFDKNLGKYRPVEQRDIVILLRSVAEKGQIFEEALMSRGIDAYAELNGGFFEAREIQTMLSLLQILDNPRQDIPLLSVLRSPIVGLDFDELLQIRKGYEEGDFYTALLHYIEAGKASELLLDFYKLFMDYRHKISLVPIEQLLSSLYIDTGYYRYVGMLPTGAKKKANLKMLKKYAEEFEGSIGVGLFQFLQYMEKLKNTGAKVAEAKLVGENENLVRIMTIHKSKGLEFPIVFVSNTSKKFNNQDIMNSVLLHSDLGFGPKYIEREDNILYETVPFQAIKETIVAENTSEEMRVLYVALTRAKEKLYITGVTKDFDKQIEKWSQFAAREEQAILPLGLKKSPSYMNWIGMSLMGHSQGERLRQKIGANFNYLFEGNAEWTIEKWTKSALSTSKKEVQEQVEHHWEVLETWDSSVDHSEQKEEIYKRLDYMYPHLEATFLPTKVAVSDIKKKEQEAQTPEVTLFKEVLKPIPKFMQGEEGLGAAAKGTLIHSVFEHIDLMKLTTKDAISEQIEQLIGLGKLDEQVRHMISVDKLVTVAQSSIIERMRVARHVWKEKAFVYLMNANEVDEDYPADEQILLQGVVDNCFIEEDGLVIVDYKTDYIDPYKVQEGIEKIRQRYQIQLDLYGKALSDITTMQVKEKIIYLYSIDTWINL